MFQVVYLYAKFHVQQRNVFSDSGWAHRERRPAASHHRLNADQLIKKKSHASQRVHCPTKVSIEQVFPRINHYTTFRFRPSIHCTDFRLNNHYGRSNGHGTAPIFAAQVSPPVPKTILIQQGIFLVRYLECKLRISGPQQNHRRRNDQQAEHPPVQQAHGPWPNSSFHCADPPMHRSLYKFPCSCEYSLCGFPCK